jgi:hypothetical protein
VSLVRPHCGIAGEKKDKKLLILNLDGTLIYATDCILPQNTDSCVGDFYGHRNPQTGFPLQQHRGPYNFFP